MPRATPRAAVATFASGCFWCTESDFEMVPGVLDVVSGLHRRHPAEPELRAGLAGG
jgi:peptide methionine sulfoxide reductase MsrA